MNANVTWKHGMSFEGSAAPSGFSLQLGTDPAVGGSNDGFRPLELFLIGLAGCTAMDTISILSKMKQDVTGFEVNVQAEQKNEHPRAFIKVVLEYVITGNKIDDSAVERAVKLSEERYCPAQAMLSPTVPIEHKIKILKLS